MGLPPKPPRCLGRVSMGKLFGSAGSLERLRQGIEKFYCGTTITLTELPSGEWSVSNLRGVIEGVTVRKVKGRYRFESVDHDTIALCRNAGDT